MVETAELKIWNLIVDAERQTERLKTLEKIEAARALIWSCRRTNIQTLGELLQLAKMASVKNMPEALGKVKRLVEGKVSG